jgi:uncharacterized membrane protein
MGLLILGVVLWSVSHLLRLSPGLRNAMPEPTRKLVVTVLALLAVALMVIGFRAAAVVVLWDPPDFLRGVNNLLMLVAVFLVGLGFSRGALRTRLRHPMLISVMVWAVAHLMVNGDLASLLLFGGLLVWAVVARALINRDVPLWVPPAPGPLRNDVIYGAVALAVFAAIAGLHSWLGYPPFG